AKLPAESKTADVRKFSPVFSVRTPTRVKSERLTFTTTPGDVTSCVDVPKYAKPLAESMTAEDRLSMFRIKRPPLVKSERLTFTITPVAAPKQAKPLAELITVAKR